MEKNELYPIFLKVNELQVLIVGGGNVALEKLSFLLKSSPRAQVDVVSKNFCSQVVDLSNRHHIRLIKSPYHSEYLSGKHVVIATTDEPTTNVEVYQDCKERNILVNVADHPDFCDFYMGGIVTKGNVKLAISTNGKSPTMAKRLRQFFEDFIPNEVDDFVKNMNAYRKTLKGDFYKKLEILNKHTENLIKKN